MFKNLIGPLFIPYCVLFAGLITNILQFFTLFVWPFDKLLYRKINYFLTYLFYANYTAVLKYWSCTNVDVYMRQDDLKYFSKENSLVVMNHTYDTDWLLGLVVCQRLGLLGGTKIAAKQIIKYFPIFGWNLIFGENIFLKRSWDSDANEIQRKFRSILDLPKNYFFNIIILCEGTRFTDEKHKISMEVAKTKGLAQLKHHLLPRTKGFTTLMQLGKQKIDAIYDCTLVMERNCGNVMTILRGEPMQPKLLITRIPIKNVPIDDEKKCADFLYKVYEEKDKIVDNYVQTGNLSDVGRLEIKENHNDYWLSIMWIVLILPLSFYYILQALWLCSPFLKLVIIVLFLSLHFMTKRLLGESMTEKSSSSFGLKKSN